MERLTERTADGMLVKEDYGEKAFKTLYQCYGAKPMPHYANCDEGYCAMEKLAEYEDLEHQGKLPKLPCAVGDFVLFSNGVILPVVYITLSNPKEGISIGCQNGIHISMNLHYGSWCKGFFKTHEEAESALKELEDKKAWQH